MIIFSMSSVAHHFLWQLWTPRIFRNGLFLDDENPNCIGPTNYRKTPQDTARHRKTPQDTERHRKTPKDTTRDLKCKVIINIQGLRVITTVYCWGRVGLMMPQNLFWKVLFFHNSCKNAIKNVLPFLDFVISQETDLN